MCATATLAEPANDPSLQRSVPPFFRRAVHGSPLVPGVPVNIAGVNQVGPGIDCRATVVQVSIAN